MLPAGAAKEVAAVLVGETRPVWCVLGAAAGCHPTLLSLGPAGATCKERSLLGGVGWEGWQDGCLLALARKESGGLRVCRVRVLGLQFGAL